MRGGAMNLDQMPAGARMDAEIARRVFGYRAFVDEVGAHQYPYPDGVSEWAPYYSSKIRDAWLVVDHLLADGWFVAVHAYSTGATADVTCVHGPCERHGNPEHTWHGVTGVEGATVPEALCRAALLAIGTDAPLGEPPSPGVRQPRRGRVTR